MTIKEKAQELVAKFRIIQTEVLDYDSGFALNGKMEIPSAKRCALIAVDEILSLIDGKDFLALERFWNDVKTEIEKL